MEIRDIDLVEEADHGIGDEFGAELGLFVKICAGDNAEKEAIKC